MIVKIIKVFLVNYPTADKQGLLIFGLCHGRLSNQFYSKFKIKEYKKYGYVLIEYSIVQYSTCSTVCFFYF